MKLKLSTAAMLLAVASTPFAASLQGETGYLNMPNGRIEPDGTFRMGYSFGKPYANIWSSMAFLPRVELYARYVRIMGIPGGTGKNWENYGDYKDKVASGKFLLLEEDWITPSLALGINDVQGTNLFNAKYIAASKRFGDLDATIGYGNGRIDGFFAGARYTPQVGDGWSFVAEYDANNYAQDKGAQQNGVAQRKKGVGIAAEYQWGWLTSQIGYRDGEPSINAYASVPFQQREFIPKIHEPQPDTEIVPRPTFSQWQRDPQYQRDLTKRLLEQEFKNIQIHATEHVLEVKLTNTRIALASRAVGRAARTLLLRAPYGVREIKVHYTVNELPVVTYTFFDTERLQRYFNGFISRKELASYVAISYADPEQVHDSDKLDELEQGYYQAKLDGEEGDLLSFRGQGAGLSKVKVAPSMGIFFNDPSGAFRYEVFATASVEKQAGNSLFLKASGSLMLHENISGVTQPSNSLLPHVRTDVADYKRDSKIKLNQLLVNKYFQPQQRVYARASAGLYEEMFGGVGGQVLYYPEKSPWALDVAVDALRQRDVGGRLDFRDYSTVTALASLHYRLPLAGVTATVRAGRFLAKDSGVRLEMKRHFRSGFQFGAWYSMTNGNDITSPGSPDDPYNDKGIFVVIPLNSMLTKDTRAAPRMSMSPWTRDVAQMVESPGDLYNIMEPTYVNMHDHDGLQYFADWDDSYRLSERADIFDRIKWSSWQDDRKKIWSGLTSGDTWLKTGVGLGVVALSSVLDKSSDKWATRHEKGRLNKAVANIGNNLPLLVGGVAGFLVLDSSNERLYDTSFSALEAGAVGLVASEAGKYLFGRARPKLGKGHHSFNPLEKSGDPGFPSGHTTLMWSLVTPYAKEYDAPWLYGLAALTNIARVADRKHWFSDTVGGALLGYTIGDALWRWHNEDGPKVSVSGDGVHITWEMK